VAHLQAAMGFLAGQPGAWVSNVCTGGETSVLRLAEVLGRVFGCGAAIGHGPARVGDIRRSVGAPERAVALLGVRADIGLEDGLTRLAGRAGLKV
jgi:UDP-glucose 4-epimerase